MQRVTYYIGAGASYNSLPLYNDFPERLSVFRDYIFHYQKKKSEIEKQKFGYYIDKLNALINLLNPLENPTLDILAHELYDNQNTQRELSFHQLKFLVSDFFVFEQLNKSKTEYLTQIPDGVQISGFECYNESICQKVNAYLDRRYKSFILPTRKQNKKFSDEINFISWNYDQQIEMAYAQLDACSLELIQKKLQVYPSPATTNGIDLSQSAIIKLNGTAGIYKTQFPSKPIENFIDKNFVWHDQYLDIMNDVFYNNSGRIMGGLPFFKFYFEDSQGMNEQAIKYANHIMEQTNILIVIGYSFHPSNRTVDNKVFENVTKLNKVIFQTREQDYEIVKHNYLNVHPNSKNIISRFPDINNFPTPNNV